MRLPRPHIPLEVRCRVACRQLGEMWVDDTIEAWRTALGVLLEHRLKTLADLLGCEVKDLHLDHQPALAAREKIKRRGVVVGYKPAANSPDHLIYRTAEAHRFKTNVRGEGAQFPDRVLIKRERRREKPLRRAKRKWTSRPFPKSGKRFQSRGFP